MKPLEPWPELSEFIRQLVRAEVATAVESEMRTAIDSLMEEIRGDSAPRPAIPAPRPVLVAQRGRRRDEWLTASRAARIAGVKPKTIRSWILAGRLSRYGTRQRVLVLRAELDQLLLRGPDTPARLRVVNGHAS